MEKPPTYIPRQLKRESATYRIVNWEWPVMITRLVSSTWGKKEAVFDVIIDSADQLLVSELRQISQELALLKNELVTNKPITLLNQRTEDLQIWNDLIVEMRDGKESCCWYSLPFLFIEAYFFRRITEIGLKTIYFESFDPFAAFKDATLDMFDDQVEKLIGTLRDALKQTNTVDNNQQLLKNFLRTSISASNCEHVFFNNEPLSQEEEVLELLVDRTHQLIQFLDQANQKDHNKPFVLGFVVNNTGYELLADFCLILFVQRIFVSARKVTVQFLVKQDPTFLAAVKTDVETTKTHLVSLLTKANFSPEVCKTVNSWAIHQDIFWNYPFGYTQLPTIAPELYDRLKSCSLVFIKGDHNYRRLVDDRQWPPTTSLCDVLARSHHSFPPLIALRLIRSEPIVGFHPDHDTLNDKTHGDCHVESNGASVPDIPVDYCNGQFGLVDFKL